MEGWRGVHIYTVKYLSSSAWEGEISADIIWGKEMKKGKNK
jgi:hypothetical protein